MTAAQVSVYKNVVRVGETLTIGFTPTGDGSASKVEYVLRYEFGSLSGELARNPSYNSYSWTLPDSIKEELASRYVMDGMIYLDTYGDAVLIATTQTSFTVASSSTAVIIPDLSSYNIEVGDTLKLILRRQSNIYSVQNLKYTFGTVSKAISFSWPTATATAGNKEITIPLETAKGIPDATSGYLEFSCDTYSSMADRVVCSVTVRVLMRIPENDATKPTLSMTTEAESTLDDAFDGLYIRGKTKVRVTLEASSNASDIAAHTIQVGSEMVVGSEAIFELTGNTMTIRGTVTDKRGYGATLSRTITSMAYTAPSVAPLTGKTQIVCARCLSDGTLSQKGEFLLIQARRRYTTIESGGQQLNKCVLRYRIRTAGGDFSNWVELLGEGAASNEYNGVVSGVVLSAKTGYSVQIGVADTIGEFHNVTVPIPAVGVPFHVGKGNRNVSVGGFCDYSRADVFDVHFTQYFFTGAKAQTVFEDGSWAAGMELGASVPDADLNGLGTYNLLIAVSGGNPVLLVKAGDKIAGGDIQIQYALTDGVDYLTLTSGGPITALYKLL